MALWRIVSENGVSLKTASILAMLKAGDNPNVLPNVRATVITTGEAEPIISGYTLEMDQLVMTVIISGANKQAVYNSLLTSPWNNRTKEVHPLVAEEDVSGEQWYINVRLSQIVRGKGWTFKVYFDITSRVWRKVRDDIVWNVTSSPSTQDVTMEGNQNVTPTLIFKPNGVKADGALWRKWLGIVNPHTDHGFTFYGVCLTHSDMDTRSWVKDTGNYVMINSVGGILAGAATIPYDTLTEADAGSIGTYGMGYIDDGVNQSQIAWTGRTGTNSGDLTGVTWNIGGTSSYAIANNVKIYLSRAQADGRDVRFYCDDALQNIWITGFNTATTRIWYVAREPAGIEMSLGEAIASSGSVSEIQLKRTAENIAAIGTLPPSGVVLIDSEPFHYTDRDPIRCIIFSDARELYDQPMASHSVGATVKYLAHEYWFYSGNPSLTAQVTNDTRKPPFNLSTSDNETRDYAEFGSPTNLRANSWIGKVHKTDYPNDEASKIYYGNHLDDSVDPYTDMGMLMQSIYKGSWRGENGSMTWSIYDPAGIDNVVQWVYEKFRNSSSWPAYVKLEKSKDGKVWLPLSVVTAPTVGAWATVTVSSLSLGADYYYLRVIFYGAQAQGQTGGVGYYSALETNSLKYETAEPLTIVMGDWNTNTYEFDGLFRNHTTGHFFRLEGFVKQGEELEVDCTRKIVKTLSDNKRRRSILRVSGTQNNWMEFQPGANDLRYTESGVTGVEITIQAEDMQVV